MTQVVPDSQFTSPVVARFGWTGAQCVVRQKRKVTVHLKASVGKKSR